MYVSIRDEVFGMVSDQGTEQGYSDVMEMDPSAGPAASSASRPDGARGYLFRRCLLMPEHLHIVYNSLQHAVEGMLEYTHVLPRLRALERFASSKSFKKLFISSCLDGDDTGFKVPGGVILINWRWEVLTDSLDRLMPIFKILKDKYDVQKMEFNNDGVKGGLN